MTHFLKLNDLDTTQILHILDRADVLHECWHGNRMPQTLQGQRLALWFFGNGFRNRMAFEIGARAMGADVSYVPGDLGVNEPLEDIGHYLQNWFSMLVIRARNHADLLSVAEQVSVPVINARTDHNHPCEIMGDLQYIRRRRGSLDGLNVVFVGEVTNLCMSWFEAATRLPISVTQVAPQGFGLPTEQVAGLNVGACGRISVTTDIREICSDTEVIYTDCWPKRIGLEQASALFAPYCITPEVLAWMNPQGVFLPCPPVTRGQEVSAEAMRSPLCADYAAKEFLLHAQNAIMESLL